MVTPLFAQIVFIGGYNVVTPSYFFGFNLHGLVRYIYQNLSETQQLARFLLNKKKDQDWSHPFYVNDHHEVGYMNW